jgi:uncharacterized NAD-dependent epimerase/dehydratase family protein
VIEKPYLLFLGDVPDQLAAKTAQGVVDWRPETCMGQLRLDGCKADVRLPEMTINQAVIKGVRTFVVGVANAGGVLPPQWTQTIVQAIEAGMDVASGMHTRLVDVPEIRQAAERHGAKLFDVRHPTQVFATGKGTRRPGKRILAVGTDCSCGKMYTTLALEKAMRERGMKADFRATGQTGILITGEGVSIDAVVADFISGAVEWLCPANDADHWDLVEGQGSLFHASFAGVSAGLIHGAQPDALVLCHEPTRTHMRGLPGYPIPDLAECMDLNLRLARLTNPQARFVGVAINTAALAAGDARRFLDDTEQRLGLPTVDPVRDGVARVVDALP